MPLARARDARGELGKRGPEGEDHDPDEAVVEAELEGEPGRAVDDELGAEADGDAPQDRAQPGTRSLCLLLLDVRRRRLRAPPAQEDQLEGVRHEEQRHDPRLDPREDLVAQHEVEQREGEDQRSALADGEPAHQGPRQDQPHRAEHQPRVRDVRPQDVPERLARAAGVGREARDDDLGEGRAPGHHGQPDDPAIHAPAGRQGRGTLHERVGALGE